MSTKVTLTGRLIKDPELKFSAKGMAVATFAVVTSERFKDQSDVWGDKNVTFWNCVAFGQLAEGCAESLVKGTAVIVSGRAYQEEWEAKDGTKRRSLKVTADDVAPSLRWASAKVARTDRSVGQSGQSPAADPWASAPDGGGFDEPPF